MPDLNVTLKGVPERRLGQVKAKLEKLKRVYGIESVEVSEAAAPRPPAPKAAGGSRQARR